MIRAVYDIMKVVGYDIYNGPTSFDKISIIRELAK